MAFKRMALTVLPVCVMRYTLGYVPYPAIGPEFSIRASQSPLKFHTVSPLGSWTFRAAGVFEVLPLDCADLTIWVCMSASSVEQPRGIAATSITIPRPSLVHITDPPPVARCPRDRTVQPTAVSPVTRRQMAVG